MLISAMTYPRPISNSLSTRLNNTVLLIQIQIQIHMFIADIKVHIQYTIKIFKLKCYNDFTLYLNTNHNELTIKK